MPALVPMINRALPRYLPAPLFEAAEKEKLVQSRRTGGLSFRGRHQVSNALLGHYRFIAHLAVACVLAGAGDGRRSDSFPRSKIRVVALFSARHLGANFPISDLAAAIASYF